MLVPHRERASALPAAPERLVELNDAQQLVQLDLPEVQLGLKQIPVGIQGVELGVDAPPGIACTSTFPPLKHRYRATLAFLWFPALLGERSLHWLLR